MANLKAKAMAYGTANLDTNNPRTVLARLYKDTQSMDKVADTLGVTRTCVADNMRQMNLKIGKPGRRPVIHDRAEELDYDSVDVFFIKNSESTVASMAAKLKLSTTTVQRHYDEWLKKF